LPASASLGGDVASVSRDQAHLNATEQGAVTVAGNTTHELRLPGGTLVREYVSATGVVFAVTWRGPFRPDLHQLLGLYFGMFQRAAQAARSPRTTRGPLAIETPQLVVHMDGHPRAFFGRAYVPSLVPSSFSVSDLQ
jgi:Protein of unknown function (DUF2844)